MDFHMVRLLFESVSLMFCFKLLFILDLTNTVLSKTIPLEAYL
jgi:hypothetical protein